MGPGSFLQDLVITLTAALLVLLPSRRLRIPSAVGFMLTGILIGPGALGWIDDPHHVETLADIGVSVLLFIIGLEFSLSRLREIWRAFLIAGPLQVVVTVAGTAALLLALPVGATPPQAVFAGMLLALSSTAMVLRLLAERGETHAPQGRLLLGMLLFQDVAIVPMLVAVPILAGTSRLAMGPGLLIGAAGVGAVFLLARYGMPRLVNAVIRSGVRELYVMMAVAVCLGAALITGALGLSPALGAFLAGLLVSESEYSHQVVAEILPFRDLFSSVFFISIGMLLAPAQLWPMATDVGSWLLLTLVLKALAAGAIVRLLGFPLRIAVIVGISIAQVGEFSFVLARIGLEQGLLTPTQNQQLLAVAVLSLILTPFLLRIAAWAGAHTGKHSHLPPRGVTVPSHASDAEIPAVTASAGAPSTKSPRLQDHVIVAGYGVNGRNVSRVMREMGIPYVVLELDTAIIRRAREAGEHVMFGDVSRPDGLHDCGIENAAVLVLAISDPAATRFGVLHARQKNPRVYIIARTRLVAEVKELYRLGADEVIPEEFETSIAILARVLRRLHVPANIVRLQEQALRQEGYSFLRGSDLTGTLMTSVTRMIEGATTDTFYLEPESPAVGKSLSEIDLRGKTRALVIAVVRDGKHTLGPEADFVFRARDILVLVGDHRALDDAFELLGGD